MVSKFVFLCAIATGLALKLSREFSKDKVIEFDKFWDPCPNENTSSQIRNMKLSGTQEDMTFDYEYVNSMPFDKPNQIVIEVERCASRESPDTCVKLAALRSDKFCGMLDSDRDFFSPMVTCTNPRIKCPIPPGVYKGSNCSFDMKLFKWFPVLQYYWRIKTKIFFKKPKILNVCALIEGMARQKRRT